MNESYDYIVVGAGSAGCVLADRLTEDEQNDVLLLEAGGPDDKEEIDIPMAFGQLLKTDYDWDYMSAPQQHLRGRQVYHPRGKVLGGSSSLNALIYFRGHPWDYDHWEELGNEGWSFDDMLPYFKRAEDFAGGEKKHRNTGGKLNIQKVSNDTGVSDRLSEAAQEVGHSWNEDLNVGEMDGIGQGQSNIKDGKRHSTADAYLRPALSRNNLSAETYARVTSIRFDGNQAVGVTYQQDGNEYQVDANKEIILSSGAFGSPHLLLLSGVGHSAQLEEHDIDVVSHLPGVGKNLQDHLMGVVTYETAKPFQLGPTEHMTQNILFDREDPDDPTPDVLMYLNSALFMRHGFDNPEGKQGYTITFHYTYPESEGELTLRSADPFDDPRIDFKYLSDQRDLDRLVWGLKQAREIGEADALDEYRGEELWPGEDVQTDEEIIDHLRDTVQTGYHPVGTCKMGTDEMAVVDNRLRVKGTDGLRVVDASVMPYISVANTQGPIIGIAEKASDMVKEDA